MNRPVESRVPRAVSLKLIRAICGMAVVTAGNALLAMILIRPDLLFGTRLSLRPTESTSDRLFLALTATMAVVGAVVVVRSLVRLMRFRRGMMQSCPKCARAMESHGTRLRCPRCQEDIEADDVEQYWTGYSEHREYETPPGRMTLRARMIWFWQVRTGESLRRAVLPMSIIAAMMYFPMRQLIGSSWLLFLYSLPMGVLMIFGLSLVQHGWYRRVGTDPVCARCGYGRDPQTRARRCTECRAWWADERFVPRGEPVRSLALVLCGFIVLGAAVVFGYRLERVLVQSTVPRLPTWVLIGELGNSFATDRASWSELKTRALSEEESERMAAEVISELDSRHLSMPPIGWLYEFFLERPDHPLVREWQETLASYRWSSSEPTPIRAGEESTLLIRVHTPSGFWTAHNIGMVVDAIEVDGNSLSLPRTKTHTIRTLSMMPEVQPLREFEWALSGIAFDEPGDHEVTIRWTQFILTRPSSTVEYGRSMMIRRADSGDVIPNNLMTHGTKRSLTFTITAVEER